MPLLRRALNKVPNTIPLSVRTDRTAYGPGETMQIVVCAGPAERDVEVDLGMILKSLWKPRAPGFDGLHQPLLFLLRIFGTSKSRSGPCAAGVVAGLCATV